MNYFVAALLAAIGLGSLAALGHLAYNRIRHPPQPISPAWTLAFGSLAAFTIAMIGVFLGWVVFTYFTD
jgi:hypothetical protein